MATRQAQAGLTVNETAQLSRVSAASVRKGFQDGVLRRRVVGGRLVVDPRNVAVLAVLKDIGMPLPDKDRRAVARWVFAESFDPDEALALNPSVRILVTGPVRELLENAQRYAAGKQRYIAVDPAIKAGEPVIAGTRISVYVIAERLRGGDTVEDLLEDFPHLDRESIEVANTFALANKRRGRPSRARV